MEVYFDTEGQILGPPSSCRAYVAHVTRNTDPKLIHVYAHIIIPLHHRWVFSEEVSARQDDLMDSTREIFDLHGGFRPESDYLILGGDPIHGAATIRAIPHGLAVTLLRYDLQGNTYLPFKLRGNN